MTRVNFVAHYTDGTFLSQTKGGTYKDVKRDKLQAFDLWLGDRLALRLDLRDDGLSPKRLIYRRRVQKDKFKGDVVIYIAGWKREVDGKNIQQVCYLFENGSVVMGGQFMERDFQAEIKPFEWEYDLA
jgi:hypothetical protein